MLLASSLLRPIADKTCDGSIEPELQAEPADTAMPFKSKMLINASALSPGKVILNQDGTLFEKAALA